jgi:hypothetical protein
MISPKSSFTVLVNSSDGFEDCWSPFFTLLKKYWPEYESPILLNTEKKQYDHDGLNIQCTKVQGNRESRLTWSECLMAALSRVETPLVLYMQEDYFIEYPVDDQRVSELATLMLESPEIKHIGLTHFGSAPPFEPTSDERLWSISQGSRYRISTQAGLWRKEALLAALLPWESGWMFEIFGTMRSSKRVETFLTVRRDGTYPPIRYQHTGIIKGRWSRFAEPLFEKERIFVDFTRRGFYQEESTIARKVVLLRKLLSNPRGSLRSILASLA